MERQDKTGNMSGEKRIKNKDVDVPQSERDTIQKGISPFMYPTHYAICRNSDDSLSPWVGADGGRCTDNFRNPKNTTEEGLR